MDVKMSKKAQAVWDQIKDGAVLVCYSDAMGRSSYALRGSDGQDVVLPKQTAYQIDFRSMRLVSKDRSCQVWAAK